MMGYSPQHSGTQPQSQFNVPQCPITQSQCEQLLSFLAFQSLKEASNHQVAPAYQAASVLSPLTNVAASSSASLPPHFVNNFSGNPFWLPPNLSHSIFSAQYVDRQAYKP